MIVRRLKLTDQALTTLEPIEKDHLLAEFTNAVGPDGKVVYANGVRHARAMYPILAVDELEQ